MHPVLCSRSAALRALTDPAHSQDNKLVSSEILPLDQPEPEASPVSICLRGTSLGVMWSNGSLQQLSLSAPSDPPACQLEPLLHHAGLGLKLAGLDTAPGASRKRKADNSASHSSDKRQKKAGGCLPGLAQVSDELLAVAGWLEQSSSEGSATQSTRRLQLSVRDLQFGSCWARAVLRRPSAAVQAVQVSSALPWTVQRLQAAWLEVAHPVWRLRPWQLAWADVHPVSSG